MRKVTVADHDAFRAVLRMGAAGIDAEDIVETVADEVAGLLDRPGQRRKAVEVARVLAILDEARGEAGEALPPTSCSS